MTATSKKKTTLETIAVFTNGGAWNQTEYSDEGVPVVRVTDIKNETVDLSECKYLPKSSLKKYAKHLLRTGDLVICTVGSHPSQPGSVVGRAVVIPETAHSALLNQNAVCIRSASPDIDQGWLGYLGRNREFHDYIISCARGSANQVRMAIGLLKKMPVEVPPLIVQQRIARILSAYDDLIGNNTRRIKILEEMAQAIYREWFVNFRFPGYEQAKMVDSPLGMVPEGWEVVTVEQIIRRVSAGKKYDNKTVSSTGAVPVLDQGKSGVIGYHNDEAGIIASELNPIIVFANHTCYQRLIHFPFSAIQNVLPFLPARENQRSIYWLHWATKDLIQFNDYKGHWPEFIGKELLFPDTKTSDIFEKYVRPIVQLIWKLEGKNQNLRQTRELLLPKLISGQVDVADFIEIV